MFGYQASDEGNALLSASKDWGKAIGLEVMAAFGPMGLTLLFEMLLGSQAIPGSGNPRVVVERQTPPVSSIALPAGSLAEAAQFATVIEPDDGKPAPLPPSPRKRSTKRKHASESRPGNVIPFTKKPWQGEVLTLLSGGKTQREVAAALGIGERTVRRIVAASKSGQAVTDLAAS